MFIMRILLPITRAAGWSGRWLGVRSFRDANQPCIVECDLVGMTAMHSKPAG